MRSPSCNTQGKRRAQHKSRDPKNIVTNLAVQGILREGRACAILGEQKAKTMAKQGEYLAKETPSFFGQSEEFLQSFPGRKRRWRITLFRHEPVEGGVQNTVIQTFENARSYCVTSRLSLQPGQLHFFDENGKEVFVSSMPFIAQEIAPSEEQSSPAKIQIPDHAQN
jgi:hypothetical protein